MYARRFMDVIYSGGRQAAHRKYLRLKILFTTTADHVCQKFVRGLEESDWARFDYYSRRIRRLGRTLFDDIDNRDYDVHENILSTLGTYRPARILFPNLRAIIFDSESTIALSYAQSIFGPSITSVSFTGRDPPPHLPALCTSLLRLSPHIREVRYHCSPTPPPAFFGLILGLQNLYAVQVHRDSYDKFPMNVWEHLARLPSLREVEGFLLKPAYCIPLMNLNTSPFMSLRTFDFSADWTTCGSIMNLIHCSLEGLFVSVPTSEDPWPVSALGQFTSPFSQHPCRDSLTTIRLFTPNFNVGDPVTSLSEALQPLFLCAKLQDVEFVSLPLHFLDDTWLLNAALSWKSLRRLCLRVGCEQTLKAGTNFSLAGLVPLAKHCLDLHTLHLSFHARAVHPTSLHDAWSRNVRSLTAGWDSTILSPHQVTRSLITLFPDLGDIGVEEGTANMKAWEEVNTWIHASAYNE
jgi:hypothetical protein